MIGYILTIDCGTQSVRALLFDTEGRLVDKEKVEYRPYFSDKPGWAEQDPEVWWKGLCDAVGGLKSRRTGEFAELLGVGITSQRDSMIHMDREGNPLRPSLLWLDQRKADPVYHPRGITRFVYSMVGMKEAICKTQVDGKGNWVRQYEPEIWDKTYKYAQVSGFLNHRLTGEFKDSTASQIGHIPFNYKKNRWAEQNELNQRLFPVEPEKLMDLVEPGERIGTVTTEAARRTGISEGLPVIACGSDKGCETLGMGVLDTTMASLSFGTTATVQTTSGKYFEPLRFMPAYPAPIPGWYNPEVEIFRGYWMISWFKEEFGYKEVREAEKEGVPPEIVINRHLETVPPGSMGLMVQPYWSPGLKMPTAKGTIIGFGDVHTRAHVYRAVIEGLAYALKEGLEKIERAGRTKVERLAVSGGASQSDEICRISADIFDLPLIRGETFETAGLGAAVVTAVGLDIYPDFRSAVGGMVRYGDSFEPEPANAELYDKLYKRVYLKIYSGMEDLYDEIRELIGYPEKIT
jgi:sugar (pentulose or hexulose) kinase